MKKGITSSVFSRQILTTAESKMKSICWCKKPDILHQDTHCVKASKSKTISRGPEHPVGSMGPIPLDPLLQDKWFTPLNFRAQQICRYCWWSFNLGKDAHKEVLRCSDANPILYPFLYWTGLWRSSILSFYLSHIYTSECTLPS